MNKNNIDFLKSEIKKYKNISFDKNIETSKIFMNTDIMISDISGMIPEFYIFNKPIIYTKVLDNYYLSNHLKTFSTGFYTVENEKELIEQLNNLNTPDKINNDKLKKNREYNINTYYKKYKNSCKNICDVLVKLKYKISY